MHTEFFFFFLLWSIGPFTQIHECEGQKKFMKNFTFKELIWKTYTGNISFDHFGLHIMLACVYDYSKTLIDSKEEEK